ncbi:MAG: hypothetical protein MR779_00945 [Tenericutes bacterium]|nr:hypothetical protein [Mycoplasmatota bacterium]
MGIFSWFVADEDDKVVAKVDVHSDGKVHEYRYTEPDRIEEGHGHYIFNNLEDYENDDPAKFRNEKDKESRNKDWNGNGFCLSTDDLKQIKEFLLYERYSTTAKLLMKR